MMERLKDFNVKVTVRSARILKQVEEKFGSQSNMARETGIGIARINSFVCLRTPPVNKWGWTEVAESFASALGVYPSELWPSYMQDVVLKRSTAELSLDLDEVQCLVAPQEDSIDQKEAVKLLDGAVNERQKIAFDMHVDDRTYIEIGEVLGVTVERARQITFAAKRKMMNRLRANGIRNLSDACDLG